MALIVSEFFAARYGFDAAQVVAGRAQLLLTLEARDPTLATSVYEIRNYAPADVRFGTRYADAVTIDEGGTTMADLTKIGELEPDAGERPGWGDWEEVPE